MAMIVSTFVVCAIFAPFVGQCLVVASTIDELAPLCAHEDANVDGTVTDGVISTCKELDAVRRVHRRLDYDRDGFIEPEETDDFISEVDNSSTLPTGEQAGHDSLTSTDLWLTWQQSEVRAWSTEQLIELWLIEFVDLPDYADNFRQAAINGTHLPQVATSSSFLANVLHIENQIDKSRLMLKALDVVLFGLSTRRLKSVSAVGGEPTVRDLILTSLLIITAACLMSARQQNRHSVVRMQKMNAELENLIRQDAKLRDLLLQSSPRRKSTSEMSASDECQLLPSSPADQRRPTDDDTNDLRQQLEVAKQIIASYRQGACSVHLHKLLQMTYEFERLSFEKRKSDAERLLSSAKDACDRLRKKRNSFFSAFASVHDSSMDSVDKSISDARAALVAVISELEERITRWSQIEVELNIVIMDECPSLEVLRDQLAALPYLDVRSQTSDDGNSSRQSPPAPLSKSPSGSSIAEAHESLARARWSKIRHSVHFQRRHVNDHFGQNAIATETIPEEVVRRTLQKSETVPNFFVDADASRSQSADSSPKQPTQKSFGRLNPVKVRKKSLFGGSRFHFPSTLA